MKHKESKITIKSDIDVAATLNCGQVFRFFSEPDGYFTLVSKNMAITLKNENCKLYIKEITGDRQYFLDYFDIKRDYNEINKKLCCDDFMKCAVEFGRGIKILKQDFFECLISFIISQCNNIPRIKQIIEKLCTLYGEPFLHNGKTLYSFPTAKRLAELTADDLAQIKAGYRAEYIIAAAKAYEAGVFEGIFNADNKTARQMLLSVHGVGNKVCDCVMLFALNRLDSFPVDTWVKKALTKIYDKNLDTTVFGSFAGLAQQYIFYYARENKLEI